MDWEEHYRLWSEAFQADHEGEADELLHAAGERAAQNSPEDWQWLRAALDDPQKKWFVANVFRFQPVPERMFVPMLRTAVYERNPSLNRDFIEPCMRSFGARQVNGELLQYLESGTDAEKAGAATAFYWALLYFSEFPATDTGHIRELRELRDRIRCQMLREFVNNENLDVRRRIIAELPLRESWYPEEVWPLVSRAIEIARSHPDKYLRRSAGIPLGAGTPTFDGE